MTIGSYPDWTVAAARKRAIEIKRAVDTGQDPMGTRHAERNAPTVTDLWERYVADVLPGKAPSSQRNEKAMWQQMYR